MKVTKSNINQLIKDYEALLVSPEVVTSDLRKLLITLNSYIQSNPREQVFFLILLRKDLFKFIKDFSLDEEELNDYFDDSIERCKKELVNINA